jgi:hypothetical protein
MKKLIWNTDPAASGTRERCLTDDGFDLQVYEDGEWSVYNLPVHSNQCHGQEKDIESGKEKAIKVYLAMR